MQNKLISFFLLFQLLKCCFCLTPQKIQSTLFKFVILVFIAVDCILGNIDQKLEALLEHREFEMTIQIQFLLKSLLVF
jgi:hypothetical protein